MLLLHRKRLHFSQISFIINSNAALKVSCDSLHQDFSLSFTPTRKNDALWVAGGGFVLHGFSLHLKGPGKVNKMSIFENFW